MESIILSNQGTTADDIAVIVEALKKHPSANGTLFPKPQNVTPKFAVQWALFQMAESIRNPEQGT